MLSIIKHRLKTNNGSTARLVLSFIRTTMQFSIPVIPYLHAGVYEVHRSISSILGHLMRVFYWTPLFKSQLIKVPKGLYLYSGMPLLLGELAIKLGENCRISGITTFSGRTANSSDDVRHKPQLIIGSNVDIGWQNNIAVGNKVIIEDNVRLAGKVFLAGYPGHPIDPIARAAGMAEHEDQVGDIVLEQDVWLATGVTVLAGVTIGRGTIVAAGSVVTHDLPEMVLAAGMPARVVKKL